MNQVVSIADMAVSHSPDDVLITYALGSCLGLTIYDPEAGVATAVELLQDTLAVTLAASTAYIYLKDTAYIR